MCVWCHQSKKVVQEIRSVFFVTGRQIVYLKYQSSVADRHTSETHTVLSELLRAAGEDEWSE